MAETYLKKRRDDYILKTIGYFDNERCENREIRHWRVSRDEGFAYNDEKIILNAVEKFLSNSAVEYCRTPREISSVVWKYDTSYSLDDVVQLLVDARRNNAKTFTLPFG